MTTVAQVMTRGVRSMRPDDTLMAAAQVMKQLDVGAVPVCAGDKLVGLLTDRDIVVRAVAAGLDLRHGQVAAVMSSQVHTAREDEDLQSVLHEMSEAKIRRLPVVDAQAHLVGMISLGDIAARQPQQQGEIAHTLGEISTPAMAAHPSAQALVIAPGDVALPAH